MTHLNDICGIQELCFSPLSDTTCAVKGFAEACADSARTYLMIPETDPEGRRVVAIEEAAFAGNNELHSVMIPDSVETIGKRAFAFCTSLFEIRVGRYSRLSYIGDRAFIGCERLATLSLGHLYGNLVCGKKAFAHCTRLRAVALPMGMEEISEGMFEGCRMLTLVILPEMLRVVHTAAFSACVALSEMSLPPSVRRIDDTAFSFCGKLKALSLPESECVISATAFLDCPAMPDFMRAC